MYFKDSMWSSIVDDDFVVVADGFRNDDWKLSRSKEEEEEESPYLSEDVANDGLK
jgi:hypothetical protein